ncbi:MAG: cupin domain-containing protein [Fimbriimonadaceae bacterium]
MKAKLYRWADVTPDQPIDSLSRRLVRGEQAMVAKIHVAKGCFIKPHSHVSEQISLVISGRTRWFLDDDGHEYVAGPGEVIVLPGGCRHGMEALEASDLIDIVSPPGAMGVDAQGKP